MRRAPPVDNCTSLQLLRYSFTCFDLSRTLLAIGIDQSEPVFLDDEFHRIVNGDLDRLLVFHRVQQRSIRYDAAIMVCDFLRRNLGCRHIDRYERALYPVLGQQNAVEQEQEPKQRRDSERTHSPTHFRRLALPSLRTTHYAYGVLPSLTLGFG